jgi:DNA polymerase III sliding clamp (beta) subunit (PCNA family)
MYNNCEVILDNKTGKWFLDLFSRLGAYTINDNKLMNCLNFNGKFSRVEALDSHRACYEVVDMLSNGSYLLSLDGLIPKFKKTFDSDSVIRLSCGDGKDLIFVDRSGKSLIVKREDGEFFDIQKFVDDFNNMANAEATMSFCANDMNEVCKMLVNRYREYRKPVKLVGNKDKHEVNVFYNDSRMNVSYKLSMSDSDENYEIFFNPSFIVDAIKFIGIKKDTVLHFVMFEQKKGMSVFTKDSKRFTFVLPINPNY